MKIDSNMLFISLLIVASALSATAHDEKQLSSFPAAKEALTAISGQPRIEYEFKQNTQQHRAVSVFDDGLICYEIGRSKGYLDAQFRLGDEEPLGLPKHDVLSEYIRMALLVKMENAGATSVGAAAANTIKPCVIINVYSDPREGASQSSAEDLGRRRGRRVADFISSHWKVGEVTIRSHGWKDNAIPRSDEAQGRARVEFDLSCTGPQLPDDVARLDMQRRDMRQFIEELSVPVSTVSDMPPPFSYHHGPQRPTFVWRSSPRTIDRRSTSPTTAATALLRDVCPTSTAAKLAAEQERLAKVASAERIPRRLAGTALTTAMIDEVDSLREAYGSCEARLDRLFRAIILNRCSLPTKIQD